MARFLYTNNATTQLSAPTGVGDGTIFVVAGSVFPAPTGGNFAYLTLVNGGDIEIVKLTARSGNVLTVERAQDGTVSKAFPAGAQVSLRITSAGLADFYDQIDAAALTADWASVTGKPSTFTPSAHTHTIADVTGLQTILDNKAAFSHTHAIADVTGLQTALDGKAATSHTHVIGDVTGLQTALDGKAATSHTHIIGDVTGLQTALDGKAATSHTHAAADVNSGVFNVARLGTGTPSGSNFLRGDGVWAVPAAGTVAWDDITGKPSTFTPSAHTHAIADVTGLQTALDGKGNLTGTNSWVGVQSFNRNTGAAGSTVNVSITDTTHGAGFVPRAGASNFNSGVGADDFLIYYTNGTLNTGAFTIAPWSNEGNRALRLTAAGGFTYGGNTVWHAGNFDPTTKADLTGGTFSGHVRFASGISIGADNDAYLYEGVTNALSVRTGPSSAYKYFRFDENGNFINTSSSTRIIAPMFQIGNSLSVTNASRYRDYGDVETDITTLVPGTVAGSIIESPANGHVVVGIRGNDAGDSFSVISGNQTEIWGTGGNTAYSRKMFIVRSDRHEFYTGGVERMQIDSTGKVTIPGVLNLSDSITNDRTELRFNGGLRIFNKDNTPILFGTTNTERMRIAASGNVGIGTTAPQSLLDVGVGATSAPTHKGAVRVIGGGLAGSGGLEFHSVAFESGYGWRLQAPDLGSSNTPLVFQGRSNSAAWTEHMRISATGNVGIGTTSLTHRLNVEGNTRLRGSSPTIYFRDTDHRSAMVHVNENNFYVLRGDGTDSENWNAYNGQWPLTISLEDLTATFGGRLDVWTGTVDAQAGLQRFGWSNGVARHQWVLESDAALSLYTYTSAGAFIGKSFQINNASRVVSFFTQNTGMASADGSLALMEVQGTGGGAFMAFHRPGVYAGYFGLDTDNQWKVGGWAAGAAAYALALMDTTNNGSFTASGNITAYSDERLKTDIETLDPNKVFAMRGVSFLKDGKQSSGVIAQELRKVAPELVNEDMEYLSVAYGNLTGYIIEGMKFLKNKIEALEAEIFSLKKGV